MLAGMIGHAQIGIIVSMPGPPPPRFVPRLSLASVLPAILLTVAALGLAWWLRDAWKENAVLRGEKAAMLLSQRKAASQEHLTTEALHRAARLEQMLAEIRRLPATFAAPDAASRTAKILV